MHKKKEYIHFRVIYKEVKIDKKVLKDKNYKL